MQRRLITDKLYARSTLSGDFLRFTGSSVAPPSPLLPPPIKTTKRPSKSPRLQPALFGPTSSRRVIANSRVYGMFLLTIYPRDFQHSNVFFANKRGYTYQTKNIQFEQFFTESFQFQKLCT